MQFFKDLSLSAFTAGLTIGEQGKAALFQDDGKIVALPHSPTLDSRAAYAAAVLKTPDDLKLSDVAAGFANWDKSGRTQQAAHLVFTQLRDEILSLALPPGTVLSRQTLQRRYRLSSTPIRDALIRLEEIGLVDVFPQSGTLVSLIDVPRAREAQFLRRSLELEAVRTLAVTPDAASSTPHNAVAKSISTSV